eukprot:UN27744
MEEMSLSGNALNDEIADLQQLIATKCTLKMFDVDDNNVSDESKEILRTVGKENNSLTLFFKSQRIKFQNPTGRVSEKILTVT